MRNNTLKNFYQYTSLLVYIDNFCIVATMFVQCLLTKLLLETFKPITTVLAT